MGASRRLGSVKGASDIMRRNLFGGALALGLGCALAPIAVAQQADRAADSIDLQTLRFVADPNLLDQIDPAAVTSKPVVIVPDGKIARQPRGVNIAVPPRQPEPTQALPIVVTRSPKTPATAPVAAPAASAAVTVPPPAPTANAPAAAPGKDATASWPVTLEEVHAARVAKAGAPETWPAEEIQQARARCTRILKEINAVAEMQEPIRAGSCGTPAPIKLVSIGRKPEVVLSPPAVVTCEMAEALHKWIVTGLQPLARQHLGAPVVKINKMSDYSCRNAYGRARGRLSEHGRVNALDIAGFETATGGSAMLLADWGLTERDVRQQVAAAKKEAEKREAQRIAAEIAARDNARDKHHAVSRTPQGLPPAAIGVASGAPAGGVARSTIIDDGDGPREAVTLSIAGGNNETPVRTPLDGMVGRLGGYVPKGEIVTGSVVRQTGGVSGGVAVNAAASQAGKARFLRGAHETACKLFGTVLGPEANNAHRNHLHIDMAERGARGPFCE